MAIQQYQTLSAEETSNLGKKLARTLKGGEIIALYGKLGSGKTSFIQGLAKGLKIKEPVNSPSYVLIKIYQNLIHIDLYRLENQQQIKELGLEEFFDNKKNIVAIEWADKIDSIPGSFIKISFDFISNSERKITIEYK